MNPAHELSPVQHFPDPGYHDNLQRLERDITELAAHINAASYQLLELVGIYDQQQGWGQHGLSSCAHWLQWQCGTNLAAAREKVRVAESFLADGEQASSGGDRYLVHIHCEAEVLQADGEGAESECEDGCYVTAVTPQRSKYETATTASISARKHCRRAGVLAI